MIAVSILDNSITHAHTYVIVVLHVPVVCTGIYLVHGKWKEGMVSEDFVLVCE